MQGVEGHFIDKGSLDGAPLNFYLLQFSIEITEGILKSTAWSTVWCSTVSTI